MPDQNFAGEVLPDVYYAKVPSPQAIVIPPNAANVVFIGQGNLTLTQVSTLTKGVSGYDVIPASTVSSIDSIVDFNGVSYFSPQDYSLVSPNNISWNSLGNNPASGLMYTVTYEVPNPNVGSLQTFYDTNDVVAAYGAISTSCPISLAASLFFENGGAQLNIIQQATSGYSDFLNALSLSSAYPLNVIVPLANEAMSGYETLFGDVRANVYQNSLPLNGNQRIAFLTEPAGTSINQYVADANGLAFSRIVLVSPGSTDVEINGVEETVPMYYGAAAMAGFLANPNISPAQPLTAQPLAGLIDVEIPYIRQQQIQLISNGVLLLQNVLGNVEAIRAVTTDTSEIDNYELSVVRIGDFIGGLLRVILKKQFVGTIITPSSLASVRGTITNVLNALINQNVLTAIGTISVVQDTTDPTAVDVSLQLQPAFPFNFINVEFSLSLL